MCVKTATRGPGNAKLTPNNPLPERRRILLSLAESADFAFAVIPGGPSRSLDVCNEPAQLRRSVTIIITVHISNPVANVCVISGRDIIVP
mgnify:CR=1 FL=1